MKHLYIGTISDVAQDKRLQEIKNCEGCKTLAQGFVFFPFYATDATAKGVAKSMGLKNYAKLQNIKDVI